MKKIILVIITIFFSIFLFGEANAWTCGDDIEYNGFTYHTKSTNGKCRTTTNMKHEPTSGGSYCSIGGIIEGRTGFNCNNSGRLYDLDARNNVCGQLGSGWDLPTKENIEDIGTTDQGRLGNKLNGIIQIRTGFREGNNILTFENDTHDDVNKQSYYWLKGSSNYDTFGVKSNSSELYITSHSNDYLNNHSRGIICVCSDGDSCYHDPYTYSWKTGSRGECSVTCGGGTRSVEVYCERSDGVRVSDSNCSGNKPAETESCNTQSCCGNGVVDEDKGENCDPGADPCCKNDCSGYNQVTTCDLSYDYSGVNRYGDYIWISDNIEFDINTGNCVDSTEITPTDKVNGNKSDLVYSDPKTTFKLTCNGKGGDTKTNTGDSIELDNKEPEINNINIEYFGEKYPEVNPEWTNGNIEITATINDEKSGVKSKLIYENGSGSIFLSNIFRKDFQEQDNGEAFKYELDVTDNVGNNYEILKGFKENVGTIKYDNKAPTLSSSSIDNISGIDNWTNTGVVVNFTITDKYNSRDGSGIKDFEVYEIKKDSNGNKIEETEITNYTCNPDNAQEKVCSYNKHFTTSDNGKTFTYEIRNLKDNLGNTAGISIPLPIGEVNFDDKPPKIEALSLEGGNIFSATDSQRLEVKAEEAGGAPITIIEGQFENVDNPSSFSGTNYSTGDLDSSTANILETIENISKVDNDKQPGNYRIYDYQIVKVCDKAGNCSNNLGSLKYYVYANKIDETKVQIDENFTSGNIVANGEKHSFIIKDLKDEYGNNISPVEKDGQPLREVYIDFEFYNNLHIDQYHDTNSAIGVEFNGDDKEINLGNNVKYSGTGKVNENKDGIYDFKFYSYGPTYKSGTTDGRQYIDNDEKFEIKKIIGRIEDKIPTTTTSTGEILNSLEFQFKPIYKVSFSGGIEDNGLIEGVVQGTQIDVEKNTLNELGTNKEIYFEFTDPNNLGLLDKLKLYFEEGTDWDDNLRIEVSTGSLDFNNSNSKVDLQLPKINLLTLLLQKAGEKLGEEQDTLFSSYVKYNLDFKEVIYSQEHIGDKENQKTKQTGLEVEGYISNNINTIIDGTKGKELNTLGKLTKADFRQQIESNVYKLIKNVRANNGTYKILDLTDFSNSDNSGKKLQDNNVLYFNLENDSSNVKIGDNSINSKLVTLGDGINDLEVKGKKTIVIIGADLYIKSNMYYADKNKDILGIIVLKGEDGIGGDIYIDPEVTNIVGTYYMTKAMKSGKLDSGEIKEYTNINDLKELKNQLHIYGSIFSENTIGGARSNPPKCPYYLKNCKQKEAQKYDLNFLRRYTLKGIEGGLYLPVNNGKVIGSGTCEIQNISGVDEVICSGEEKFARYIKNTKDKYAKQSTIIEYNSNFINNTPPMFK